MTHSDLLATVLIASLPGIVVAWFSAAIASRRAQTSVRHERRRHAAEVIRDQFGLLRDLTWDAYAGSPVAAGTVSRAMISFERQMARYEDLLPEGMGHLRRSAREAMATVFGSPAVAALDVRLEHEPLSEVEGYWADVAVTWHELVISRLHTWQDDPGNTSLRVTEFYAWRRETDDWYRASRTASGAIPQAFPA